MDMSSTGVIEELARELPAGTVVTDTEILTSYARDRELWAPSATPLAVVRPRSTEQIGAVMRWASRHTIPVVPRGAGSGLAGAANGIDGGIVLSLEAMDQVLAVDPVDRYAVVQPGVITADLKHLAMTHGLRYPPDPGSAEFCTIGGNVATNAGGLCCLKYGVTRDSVIGLEVVLADGRVLRLGGRTVKDVAGLDLLGLFVGSEGMLGVVTEVTVRLRPAPREIATLVATFDELSGAGRAVAGVLTEGRPSMCELMDAPTVRAVEAYRPSGLDTEAAALLLVQTDDGDAEAIERCARACEEAGARFVMTTRDDAETELLTMARRTALDALEAGGQWLLDDVCVPLSSVPDLVAGCQEIGARHAVTVACFGHIGDGNMHPTVVFDHGDTAAESRARHAAEEIARLGLRLGGTVTGEHGVGLAKRDLMAEQVGAVHLGVQRAIKHALDPAGILNPGKSLG
ncbi:FAD-binding oxidoreductase [Aeromicrobium sp. PE09-221]|uniref:FAD-binding oxidoreductase n=1 Tax=Aeromicrobium sp. PE09-221 TaxID=1898043 RepID=UPI000B3EDDCC|nr:FAD-linked oxidase C-terminal domain-containing protein [Aeromicrobium sp. PE09-221]OUZ12183.1 FAD-binding oxidoreductase [Aeromicrobium sp. PE09-221]